MATFKSALSRWVFAAAVLYGGLSSIGAAFAPGEVSFQTSLGHTRLGASIGSGVVSTPMETRFSSGCDRVSDRLEGWILTHHAIAVSA